MVDLVKIRKKAKEKKASESTAEAPAPSTEESPSRPVAESSSGKSAAGRKKGAKRASVAPAGDVQADVRADVRPIEPAAAPRSEENRAAPSAPAAESKLERFKQTAGKRREGEVVEEEEERGDRLELLTFLIAGEHYAIDIEHIVEIVTPRRVTRIPNADPSVVGIVSLRGTIVTLVDVRRKLRHPPAGEPDDETRIVIVDFHHETIGFTVDRVLRVVKTSPAEVEPHPVVHATELDESVRGVFRTGDALTILLDFEKLLDHSALAAVTA